MSQPRIFSDIRCKNFWEFSKLMEHLEKEKDGYVWNQRALKPTEYDPYDTVPRDRSIIISFVGQNRHKLVYSWYEYDGAISFTDFMKKERSYMEKFEKVDLEDLMVVKVRSGIFYMYFQKWGRLVRDDGHVDIKDYNEDLTLKKRISGFVSGVDEAEFDIVQVYELDDIYAFKFSGGSCNMNLIWERPEEVAMTVSEIEKKLGVKNLKIVAEKEN